MLQEINSQKLISTLTFCRRTHIARTLHSPAPATPSSTVFGQMKIALKNIFNIAVASPGQHRDNTELRMCRVDLLTHWLHTTT